MFTMALIIKDKPMSKSLLRVLALLACQPLAAYAGHITMQLTAAKARCAAWGYSGAEPFGGFTSQCSQPSSSGCMQTLVTIEYQCTGDIKK
ncbi:YecR-like lipofamily protein [Klebsiella quasivariicola]|uniref:YecR-like lipofamily protein n=1 Tax=Klebsiella quasivariicola TaxID=2026240 RepID=UPI002164B96E|nr:YecR-like lipofamily protein [Klebsiella quasivariicola]